MSDTGVMISREPFNMGLQMSSVHSQQPVLQVMHSPFGADGLYKPVAAASPTYQSSIVGVTGNAGGGESAREGFVDMNAQGEPVKRKRGRPRKYGPDGSMALSPAVPSAVATQSSGGFSPPPTSARLPGGSASPNSLKKARGRPPGSTNKKQFNALGVGFTPHVITVNAGEDVCSKIMSFSQNGLRAVCILTANGAISDATLRQPAMSGGTVTYEGRFEILSLSGSYLFSENGSQRSRTGGLSVSLSGPDGRVLGGGVAGLLTAATPVQVVMGSFIPDGGHKEMRQAGQILQPPFTAPHKLAPIRAGMTGTSSSPPSLGTPSESSGGPGSPFNLSGGACNNNTVSWM